MKIKMKSTYASAHGNFSKGDIVDTDIVGMSAEEVEGLIKGGYAQSAAADAKPTVDFEGTATAGPAETAEGGLNADKKAIALAAENGIDLATLKGTGKNGKVLLKDVQAALEAAKGEDSDQEDESADADESKDEGQ